MLGQLHRALAGGGDFVVIPAAVVATANLAVISVGQTLDLVSAPSALVLAVTSMLDRAVRPRYPSSSCVPPVASSVHVPLADRGCVRLSACTWCSVLVRFGLGGQASGRVEDDLVRPKTLLLLIQAVKDRVSGGS